MATLSRGGTFGATETVTNTKLHNLVDLGSISGINNADCASDMNLSDTKLADITSGGKVRGSALLNLSSTPSGAGAFPPANIPNLSVTMLSLMSIPNTALLPITLASWVDGMALRNLCSTPVDTQFRYNAMVASMASGAVPSYNGVNNLVGKTPTQLFLGSKNYSFSAYNDASQVITANTPEDLDWDTEDFDTGGNFASSTFTAPVTGIYLFTCSVLITFGNTSVAPIKLNIIKNGSAFAPIGGFYSPSNTSSHTATVGGQIIMSLTAGDTIKVSISPPLTVDLSVTGSSTGGRFTGTLLA